VHDVNSFAWSLDADFSGTSPKAAAVLALAAAANP
jgi:hypothetical protein